jgi:hypothetical protein
LETKLKAKDEAYKLRKDASEADLMNMTELKQMKRNTS